MDTGVKSRWNASEKQQCSVFHHPVPLLSTRRKQLHSRDRNRCSIFTRKWVDSSLEEFHSMWMSVFPSPETTWFSSFNPKCLISCHLRIGPGNCTESELRWPPQVFFYLKSIVRLLNTPLPARKFYATLMPTEINFFGNHLKLSTLGPHKNFNACSLYSAEGNHKVEWLQISHDVHNRDFIGDIEDVRILGESIGLWNAKSGGRINVQGAERRPLISSVATDELGLHSSY